VNRLGFHPLCQLEMLPLMLGQSFQLRGSPSGTRVRQEGVDNPYIDFNVLLYKNMKE